MVEWTFAQDDLERWWAYFETTTAGPFSFSRPPGSGPEGREMSKGRIRLEKSVTCGACEHDELGIRGRAELRNMGWRLSRQFGWLCPNCAAPPDA